MTEDRQLEFAELIRAHHARLFGFIRSLVLNANDAQDVFQETVLALWQGHETYDSSRDFGAWAIGVARNKVFDYYKAQKRRARLGDEILRQLADRQMSTAESSDFLQARRLALSACLGALSQRQQTLLRRCYDGAETVQDVAASLRRTSGSIYSSLRHIRTRLLECIQHRLGKDYGHG